MIVNKPKYTLGDEVVYNLGEGIIIGIARIERIMHLGGGKWLYNQFADYEVICKLKDWDGEIPIPKLDILPNTL